jgi:hypothetical protein
MTHPETDGFTQMPGLYRLWDLQFLISDGEDYQVHYAELTETGTPLFAVYRRPIPTLEVRQ